MNIPDIAVFLIVLVPAIIGFRKGLTKMLFSVFAWVASFFIAFRFLPLAEQLLNLDIHPMTRTSVSFVVLFLVSLGLLYLLSYVISRTMGPQGVDRIAGVCLGTALGLVWAVGVAFVLGFTQYPKQETPLFSSVSKVSDWMSVQLFPDSVARLRSYNLWQGGEGATLWEATMEPVAEGYEEFTAEMEQLAEEVEKTEWQSLDPVEPPEAE